MPDDRDDLYELVDPPRINEKSVDYISSIISTNPSCELERIDEDEGKVTLRYSTNLGFRISSDSHPPIVRLDTTVDGVLMTFDLSNTIDQIKQKSAGLDTDTCPDCDIELEMWAAGEMNEQLECPECGSRYVIDSVTFLERVREC